MLQEPSPKIVLLLAAIVFGMAWSARAQTPLAAATMAPTGRVATDSDVCPYPYDLFMKAFTSSRPIRFPSDPISYLLPHRWISPQTVRTKAGVAHIIDILRSKYQVGIFAHIMNADVPLPDDADQSTWLKDLFYPSTQGLFLFMKSRCVIEVAILNPRGLFTTTPAHFLFLPNQYVLPPPR